MQGLHVMQQMLLRGDIRGNQTGCGDIQPHAAEHDALFSHPVDFESGLESNSSLPQRIIIERIIIEPGEIGEELDGQLPSCNSIVQPQKGEFPGFEIRM